MKMSFSNRFVSAFTGASHHILFIRFNLFRNISFYGKDLISYIQTLPKDFLTFCIYNFYHDPVPSITFLSFRQFANINPAFLSGILFHLRYGKLNGAVAAAAGREHGFKSL